MSPLYKEWSRDNCVVLDLSVGTLSMDVPLEKYRFKFSHLESENPDASIEQEHVENSKRD